jgi:hypothetical protein
MRFHRRTPALVLPALSAAGMLSLALLAGCDSTDNAPTSPETQQLLKTTQDNITTKVDQAGGKGKGMGKMIRKPGQVAGGN